MTAPPATAPPAKERTAAANAVPRPAPSNAPTVFLLLLVVGAFVFVGWWAFWGDGASPEVNAVLNPPPPIAAPSVPSAPPAATGEANP